MRRSLRTRSYALERGEAAGGGVHGVAFGREHVGDELRDERLIVDDEDCRPSMGVRHAPQRSKTRARRNRSQINRFGRTAHAFSA
jgi:hypothetical protein